MKEKIKVFPNETADLDIINESDKDLIARIANALSNPLRVDILRQLQDGPRTIPELAEINNISITNCVFHTSILEETALIRIELVPSETRNVRMCYRLMRKVNINLFQVPDFSSNQKEYKLSCKVGDYVDLSDDAEVKFHTSTEAHLFDNTFMSSRKDAQVIWSPCGTITYAFPNPVQEKEEVVSINLNLELCSEVVEYNNEYKSDVTFWINDVELFTHTSPGDYGDRPGFNNPEWAKKAKVITQYGDYYNIVIKKHSVYLNGVLVNKDFDIDKLDIKKHPNKILLKIGNKVDALNKGGWNIFGKGFGDYPIDIELKITVE